MRRKTMSHLVHRSILPTNYIGSSNISFGGKLHTLLSNRNDNFNIHHKTPTIISITFSTKQSNINKNLQSRGAKLITSVTNTTEILADPSKLRGWHLNNSMILCLWNPKVFTINVHQLHFKIRNLVLCCKAQTQNTSQTKISTNSNIFS